MLKRLRNKKTSKKVWVILTILILPAFLFWGSGSLIRNKQKSNYAGKIFGRKISFLEYEDALSAVKNQAIIQFGNNFHQIQKYLNLKNQAWERLILLKEAERRKISVGDKEVRELIQSYPFFQRNSRFDRELYSSSLRYDFHTPARIFEEQTRQNLILSKLYTQITADISLTHEEIIKEYRKNNEQLSIYYIATLYAEFLNDITVSDEQCKEYFIQNSFKFKQPLSFNIEYVSLLKDKDEETMKDEIKNLLLRLNKSRTFSLKNIFHSKKVRDKKEDFIKVAKDFGLTVKETGPFKQTEPIPNIGWSPEILNLVSQAKIGQYLPPIYMDNRYYILRLKEIKQPYIPDFETIKDEVKETFIKEESQRIAKMKIEECTKELKELYKTDPHLINFDKIAKGFGLKSGSTDLFKYGSYIEGIGASDNFWMATQDLKENEFSGIIEMPAGLYVIKLKSRIPIDEEKFQAEKNEFAQRLLLHKKNEYFTKFLEELNRKAMFF